MGFPFRNRITQEINKRVGFPFSMTILCQKTLSRIQPWKHALNVRFPKSSNHFDMSKKEIDHMHCEIRPKFISFDLHSTYKKKKKLFILFSHASINAHQTKANKAISCAISTRRLLFVMKKNKKNNEPEQISHWKRRCLVLKKQSFVLKYREIHAIQGNQRHITNFTANTQSRNRSCR